MKCYSKFERMFTNIILSTIFCMKILAGYYDILTGQPIPDQCCADKKVS